MPVTFSGDLSSANFPTGASDSGLPISTGGVPAASSLAAELSSINSGVKPFTTLTIDIWGTGSDSSGNPSQTDSNAQPASQSAFPSGSSDSVLGQGATASDSGQQASDTLPVSASTQDSGVVPSAYDHPDDSSLSGSGLPLTTISGYHGSGDASPRYTVVTDTEVYWTTGPNGPSQATVLSPHTLTLGGQPTPIPDDSDSGFGNPSSRTFIGPDGKPTVVVDVGGTGSDDGNGLPSGFSIPATASVPQVSGYPDGSSQTSDGSEDGSDGSPDGSGSIVCTTFTMIGDDGLPTVVDTTWTLAGGVPMTGDSAGFPSPTMAQTFLSGIPGATASGSFPTGQASDLGDGEAFTTCFTFTTTGADGLPTAVESTVVVSPANSLTEASGGYPTGMPSIPALSNGYPNGYPNAPAFTTHLSYTFTGADGIPTVVESPVVVSAPAAVTDASAGFPNNPFSIPGASPSMVDNTGVTTCFSYTLTGADGLPIVFESTVVLNPTAPISGVPASLPTNIPQFPGASSLFPGGPGVTTSFSFTITGADGLPTVIETTLVATPTANVPGPWDGPAGPLITGASFTGLPSNVGGGALPGQPTATGIEDGQQGDGITTCTTITYLGADGLPTAVESTFVIPGAAHTDGSFPWPYPGASNGLPTGFPWQTTLPSGFPTSSDSDVMDGLEGAGSTTCTSFTVLGADGLPTVVESTWTVPGPFDTNTALPQLPNNGGSGSTGQITGIPGLPGPIGSDGTTTCTSFTVLGADGLPTVVETTWTLPDVDTLPTGTIVGFPSAVTPASGLPSGILTSTNANNAITTSFTAITIGEDGLPTPVVQTVVFTPGTEATTAGMPFPPTNSMVSDALPGQPPLSEYGAGPSGIQTILPPSIPDFTPIWSDGSLLPGSGILPPFITGTVTGTLTSTLTVTTDAAGAPIITGPSGLPLQPYDDSLADSAQLPGQGLPNGSGSDGFPSELTLWPTSVAYGGASSPLATTLRTSTWINLIPEQTTTYTLNYAFTTLTTVTTPAGMPAPARMARRQEL